MGVGVADIDAERAKILKLREVHGVEIKKVTDDSPAAKAGLKVEDIILQYNGQRVEGQEQVARMVRETPPGREVTLQVWRNGAAETVTLTMGKRTTSPVVFHAPGGEDWTIPMPELRVPVPAIPDVPRPGMSWRSTVLGVESESLNSQLAQFFGVKEGVLVRSVVKGSSAEKAGIKAGDVILKVDGTSVTSPREITSVLRSLRGAKRTIPVVISRERKEHTLNVTLEEGNGATPAVHPVRAIVGFYTRV
jgi:serine protease Do